MDINSSDKSRVDSHRREPEHGESTHAESTHAESTHGESTHGESTHGEFTHGESELGGSKHGNPDRKESGRGVPEANAPDRGNASHPDKNAREEGDDRLDPAHLPAVGQRLALRVLHFFGWTIRFRPLPGPRGIVVVYPHTSNWDFVIGLLAKWAMDLPFRWLAKDSMFRAPLLGRWFRWLGGQPVDRSAPQGMIRAQAERMNAASWYWLVITPEGTRGYRPHWKSGFYHLALEAKVPLVLVSLDYPRKVLDFTQHLWLTGDRERDLAAIRAAYAGRTGKQPENAAPIELGERRKEPRG